MRKIAAAISLFVLVACSPEYGRGFQSSDAEYMNLFKAQLDKDSIPYEIDQDGMVFYRPADEPIIDEIHKRVKTRLALVTSLKFEEEEAREYLKQLLEDKGLEYSVEERGDGTWIKWYPESKEQQEEMQMAVVQHIFDLKAGSN